MVAAGIEVVSEIVGMCAGKSRAGREIGEAARLLLPDLQCIQRYELLAGIFIEIEQELAARDALGRAIGAVAKNPAAAHERINAVFAEEREGGFSTAEAAHRERDRASLRTQKNPPRNDAGWVFERPN